LLEKVAQTVVRVYKCVMTFVSIVVYVEKNF